MVVAAPLPLRYANWDAEAEEKAATERAAWSMFEKAKEMEESGGGGGSGASSNRGKAAIKAPPPPPAAARYPVAASSSRAKAKGRFDEDGQVLPPQRKLPRHLHGDFTQKTVGHSFNAMKDGQLRTWNMQEMSCLEDAWQPEGERRAEEAAKEEESLRRHAAFGVARSRAPAAAAAAKSVNSNGSGGGSDLLSSILGGNFGVINKPTTTAQPAPATKAVVVDEEAEAARRLSEVRMREARAAEVVKRLHAAAAMDVAIPQPGGARMRLLPELGPTIGDRSMTVPLLRAGILGGIRRTLQTTADTLITDREQCKQMRISLFGMIRVLAPMVQPAHLRQSRGLGKILMLLAAAKSEPRETREAAAKLVEAVAEKREQASVQFAE